MGTIGLSGVLALHGSAEIQAVHEGDGFLIFPVFFLQFEELIEPFPGCVQVMASPGSFKKDFPATDAFFSPAFDGPDVRRAAKLFFQKQR